MRSLVASICACLLVSYPATVSTTTGKGKDDLTSIKEGISAIMLKLTNIETRLTTLEEIPGEVRDMKVLITDLVEKNAAHFKSRPYVGSMRGKTSFVGAKSSPLQTMPRSRSSESSDSLFAQSSGEANDTPVAMETPERKSISTQSSFKTADNDVDFAVSADKSVKTRVATQDFAPARSKSISDLSKATTEKIASPASAAEDTSTLVLASTKKFFLLNFHKKTWTELPVTPPPDLLLYDDVHQRLFWSKREPAAVGVFTGTDWNSKVIYQDTDNKIEDFAVDKQAKAIFIIQNKMGRGSLTMMNMNGKVVSTEALRLAESQMFRVAVDASSKTLYRSMVRRRGQGDRILTWAYTYGGKSRSRLINLILNAGHINVCAFDKYTFSVFYNNGSELHQFKLNTKSRAFMISRDRQPKPLLICPGEIELVTTSKEHVFVFDKKHVYMYDRLFNLMETLPLPELKGDEMKATAVVDLPLKT